MARHTAAATSASNDVNGPNVAAANASPRSDSGVVSVAAAPSVTALGEARAVDVVTGAPGCPAVQATPTGSRVITYTEVVLNPEWAGSNVATPADAAVSTASLQPTIAVNGTAAKGLTGSTHFIVRQPDGGIDVGVHMERLELKAAAAAQLALQQEAQGTETPAEIQQRATVIALQGSEHRAFARRRLLWLWVMAVQFVFHIVLLILCATIPRQFIDSASASSWGRSALRHRNWIRDFAFAFSNAEGECIADMAVTMAVTAAAFTGALLQRVDVLSAALMGLFVIFVLGVASMLSPVIVLRLIILVLGFQVRIGIVRWQHGVQPPLFTHLRQHLSTVRLPLWASATSCMRCRRRRRRLETVLAGSDIEAPAGPPPPHLDRSSVSLQLGEQVHTAGQARQLVWNRGAGLGRDSVILQNATRARVFVDPQGRRSVNMTGLAAVERTAPGQPNYR